MSRYFVLIILNSMDMVLTEYSIKSGLVYEYNPIMDYLISNYGFFVTGIIKTVIILIAGYLLFVKYAKMKPVYETYGYIVLLAYFTVVFYSILILIFN